MSNAFDFAADFPGFELRASASWSAPRAALFGPSGSGKSTILETLLGLRTDVRGTARLRGRRLDGAAPRERRLAWVPQDAALFPHLDANANLRFAAAPDAPFDEVVAGLELGSLLARRPRQLSGGERQRVALGRALLSGARELLLDEPLASLDRALRRRVTAFLLSQARERDLGWLLVSHDPEEVHSLADEVLLLADGRVEGTYPTREGLERALRVALAVAHE